MNLAEKRFGYTGLQSAVSGLCAAGLIVGSLNTELQAQTAATSTTAPQFVRIFVSPNGDGQRSGADQNNPMPLGQALPLIEAGARALHVQLMEGDYYFQDRNVFRLRPRRNRSSALIIEGSGNKTRLIGTYRFGEASVTSLFGLAKGDITLMNFSVSNVGAFLDVARGATVRSVRIKDVHVDTVHDGIIIDRNRNVVVDNWVIEGVTIRAYVRVGVRLAGPSTTNIRVSRTRIDGAGTNGADDCHKGGIQLYEGVNNITIENVTVANNQGCQSNYQQGDGIEADDKSGVPNLITLRNVTATGNRDGNFDLKATNMTLENLQSHAEGVSRYGYRLWKHDYNCVNCKSEAGAGGDIALYRATAVFTNPITVTEMPIWRCTPESRQSGRLQIVRAGKTVEDRTCGTP